MLDKILPIGGGLGGGSSNAATTLIVLNQLWNTQLTVPELMDIGKTLGADVPLFILGQTAFAEGIGEKLIPTQQPLMYYLVVKPNVNISTGMLFQHPELTRNTPKKAIRSITQQNFRNDCEKIVKQLYPEVEYWINWLVQYAPTRLTGTGACVFAEFQEYEKANDILKKIPKHIHAFIAEGINTSPLYWKK